MTQITINPRNVFTSCGEVYEMPGGQFMTREQMIDEAVRPWRHELAPLSAYGYDKGAETFERHARSCDLCGMAIRDIRAEFRRIVRRGADRAWGALVLAHPGQFGRAQ